MYKVTFLSPLTTPGGIHFLRDIHVLLLCKTILAQTLVTEDAIPSLSFFGKIPERYITISKTFHPKLRYFSLKDVS